MVKVKAPFGGLSASGTLGGAFTFASTKGVQYARAHAVPSNPNTALQKATRAMMAFLGTQWADMTTAQKATWDPATAGAGSSAFNAFVKSEMKRFTQFTWPRIASNQAAGTAPVLGTLTLTGQVGQISFSHVITTLNGQWGEAVCMSTTSGFSPARSNLVKVFSQQTSPVVGVLTGLAPGTYYIRPAGFNIGGTASAFLAESNGIEVT